MRRRTIWLISVLALSLIIGVWLCNAVSWASAAKGYARPQSGTLPSASELIARALGNEANLNYSGTQVMVLWPGPDAIEMTVSISHKSPNTTKIEYFDDWDRLVRIELIADSITWRYEPGEQAVYVSRIADSSPRVGSVDTDNINELQKNYTLRVVGKDEVARRETYVVSIFPKYEGNPSKKIWIDSTCPFILRVEKYRSDGSLAYLWYYTAIRFDPKLDGDDLRLRIPSGVRIVNLPGDEGLIPVDKIAAHAPFPVALPDYVPTGYELKGARITPSAAGQTIHTLYSDGFNSISLFQTLTTAEGSGAFRRIQGSEVRRVEINGREGELAERYDGKILLWMDRGYELALVGDINSDILVKMARSITPKEMPREKSGQNSAAQAWPVIIWRVIYRFLWFGDW